MNALQSATDRVFRAYYNHCQSSDEDTLFNLLNALHSFNDKLKFERNEDLFGSVSFVGLKALRNLFHHHAELLHQIKLISGAGLPISVELARLCLVERTLIERAANFPRERSPSTVMTAFKWYGTIADIEPCIFNVVVDVYEKVDALGVPPTSEEFEAFEQSYRREEEDGLNHRVTGDITCRAGDVSTILRHLFTGTAAS